jgi:hypothetical protein
MKSINSDFELPNLSDLRIRYSVDGIRPFHYGQLSKWKLVAQISKRQVGEYYTIENIYRLDIVFIAVRLFKVSLTDYKKMIDSNTTLEKWVERSYGFTLLQYLNNLQKENPDMGSHPSVRNVIKTLTDKEFVKNQKAKSPVGPTNKDFTRR